jgi:hypothetical protein
MTVAIPRGAVLADVEDVDRNEVARTITGNDPVDFVCLDTTHTFLPTPEPEGRTVLCIVCGSRVPAGLPQHGDCHAIIVPPPPTVMPEVGLVLVSPLLRSRLSAADLADLPDDATFAIVERTGAGDDWSVRLHASDDDVPRGVTPVEYGERIARLRGATDLGVQRDLLCRLTPAGWIAWDSLARTEDALNAHDGAGMDAKAQRFVVRAQRTAVAA